MELLVYEAATTNNIEFVRQALAGEYGDIPKQDLELALLRAAANGHLECVNLLLDNGVDIHAKDGGEDTALLLAAQGGHTEVVVGLLDRGAPVNYQNAVGYTALMKACELGHIKVAEILLEHGADESSNAERHEQAASGMCNGHARMPDTRLRKDLPHGFTPLMVTAINQAEGHLELIKLLLKAKVSVDEQDLEGCTVLHHAAKRCSARVLEVLLEAKADVNAQDVWGVTPLMKASAYNAIENVRILLKYGADVSIECKAKRTALSIAVRTGCEVLVDMILDAGANLDHLDAHKKAPIFIAMGHKNFSALKSLIKHGCDLNITCREMSTWQLMLVFKYAIWLKDVEMIELLYTAGACSDQCLLDYCRDEKLKEHCADTPEVFETLNELVSHPRSLCRRCRDVVRDTIRKPLPVSVDTLSLPKSLKQYLLYSDLSQLPVPGVYESPPMP